MLPTVDFSRRLLRRMISELSSGKCRSAQSTRKHCSSTFVLFFLVTLYSILMSWFTIARYQSFEAGFYDLGIFNHDFWVRITKDSNILATGIPRDHPSLSKNVLSEAMKSMEAGSVTMFG